MKSTDDLEPISTSSSTNQGGKFSSSGEISIDKEEKSSKSSNLDEDISSGSTFASERSSSSSKETILRKSSAASLSPEKPKFSGELEYGSIHQRSMEYKAGGASAPLSPTSLYLKELRERILQERLQKI
ncbi:hypothetical protein KIN20_024085 [Parelaphostrongylus tenuis]|uniref:Uncharacterized protein n=1 Tax=Parelaphostrongylus tenuis TaxID=148309 RepID=A0AAD5QTD4_PARTN|nr:hypothetical protein KIN20_024085 [Parelaphostrongylus tenuis]